MSSRRRRDRQPNLVNIVGTVDSPKYGGSPVRTTNLSTVSGDVVENTEGEETVQVTIPEDDQDTVVNIPPQMTTTSRRPRVISGIVTTQRAEDGTPIVLETRSGRRDRGGRRTVIRGRLPSGENVTTVTSRRSGRVTRPNIVNVPGPISLVTDDFSEYMPATDDVEVECKFGLDRSTGFTTRVSTSILPVDRSELSEDITRDYIWNQSTSRSIRTVGDRVYRKETLLFRDYRIDEKDNKPQYVLTAKVTAATEYDVNDVTSEQVISNATLIRDKTRYSAEYRGTILSLTYVTTTRTSTTRSGGGTPFTTEIEVEALPGTDMDQFMSVVQELSSRINQWYNAMDLYQVAMDRQSRRAPIYTRFLGTMPIAFRPSYNLQDYSVKYKMDGERVNIVIVGGNVYFMTRGDGLQFTNITISDTGRRVIDGEWIDAYLLDPDTGTIALLEDKHLIVFDMMYSSDIRLSDTYSDRYSKLEEWISTTDIQGTELVLSPLMNPVDVTIEEYTHADGTVRSVWIRDDEILYYTDGLILQSYSSPYITGTDTKQYKWKEESSITVDFRPLIKQDKIELYVGVPSGEVAVTTTTLDSIPNDQDINSQIEKGVICEFGYDRQLSTWIFHRLRTDKTSPNFVTVAFDNMESALSALNTDEMLDLLHSL